MQIEFYLPLPPEGFWSALIIYYMAGLFFSLLVTLIMEPQYKDRRFGLMDIAAVSSLWFFIVAFSVFRLGIEDSYS